MLLFLGISCIIEAVHIIGDIMNKIIMAMGLAMLVTFAGCLTWSYTVEEQKAFDAGVTVADDWFDYTTPIPVEQDINDMNTTVVPACWGQFRYITNGVYSPTIPKIVDSVNLRVSRPNVCNKGILAIVTEMDKLFAANPTWKESAKNKYMTYLNGVQNGLRLHTIALGKNKKSQGGTNSVPKVQ